MTIKYIDQMIGHNSQILIKVAINHPISLAIKPNKTNLQTRMAV